MAQGFTRRALISGILLPPLGQLCGCSSVTHRGSDCVVNTVDRENERIDVRVVDKEYLNQREDGSFDVLTHYVYDDLGRLTYMEDELGYYSDSDYNCSKSEFEYDEFNRIISVSTSYAAFDWAVGNAESFEYDDRGDCVYYSFEIVSEGIGKRELTYKRGDDGGIVSATVDDYSNLQDFTRYEVSFEYLDSGLFLRAITSEPGPIGVFLSEEKSDMDSRLYAYTSPWGTTDFLRFDESGNLASVEAFGAGYGRETRKYEYKTMTVRRDRFVPSIFSNPQGLSAYFVPSLSSDVVHEILEGRPV